MVKVTVCGKKLEPTDKCPKPGQESKKKDPLTGERLNWGAVVRPGIVRVIIQSTSPDLKVKQIGSRDQPFHSGNDWASWLGAATALKKGNYHIVVAVTTSADGSFEKPIEATRYYTIKIHAEATAGQETAAFWRWLKGAVNQIAVIAGALAAVLGALQYFWRRRRGEQDDAEPRHEEEDVVRPSAN
ncbi:hypothetical protein [Actinomadura verrucosospora]|uniref:Uncharacterized protein n=1 Tax=Actinomadura verrucosospora TaxID=46165 RepID=A0A7D3W283_ACTVE|nr:hypothetical protein [Actinomadura verrucosospora]QKG24592.1 hypothetical protein ACTIVE_6239 [Actinomadura verrucosospora]